MSFAEFGSSSNANKKRQQQQPTNAPSSGGISSTGGSSLGLDQISESLLQYQRNVDILGKIVRSLNTTHVLNPNIQEYCMQYDAQVDVIGLLEQKVSTQLQQQYQQSTVGGSNINPQRATIIVKLKRDYERVQNQAKSLQESAIVKIKEIRMATSNTNHNKNIGGGHQQHQFGDQQNMSPEALEQQQQLQIQMQIQEDRLAEEIMREREEEIRNINRGMHQVNEIYKDLANIVGEQQHHIDTIETQMDDARANAQAGLKQVEKANEKYGSNQCRIM